MAKYTQAQRPMRVVTPLGPDVLLLESFQGVEGISMPFTFHLELLSTDPGVDPNDLLKKLVTLEVDNVAGDPSHIHGLISRFVQLGTRDDLTTYRAEMVPLLWFLSLSVDSRIYQNQTVLAIIEDVFKRHGLTDFENKCSRNYAEREYCVQYRETHLNFVSRLMEEEGIFYYFKHTKDKHILVLADASSGAPPVAPPDTVEAYSEPVNFDDVVWGLEREDAVFINQVTLRDYDFTKPAFSLETTISGKGTVNEVYQYPGGYRTKPLGDNYARIELEAAEAWQRVLRGGGSVRGLRAGHKVTIDARDSAFDGAYLLLRVTHTMTGGGYRAWGQQPDIDYNNAFTCIPLDIPYRSPRFTRKPFVQGSQTAVVVGPSGEEIFVDEYARVKVQFHWDRLGKKDEKSSCWIRVASTWAGKEWGMIQIPRIGQEVIVDFLEGDPDQPIITGSVYNAAQMPPYALPSKKTQSGLKSRSTLKGEKDNFNEIRFEDLKGSELFYVHAEKDRELIVEHDNKESIGNDETVDVGNDQTISIGNNRTETVKVNESIDIGKNRTESVGEDESITIGGGRTESVKKDEKVEIGKNRNQDIGANETVKIKDKRSTDVGKDDELKVGKKLLITVADEILIKTGEASISMKKDGTITIKGKDIKLDGQGKITVKAASDVTLKGSQIKQN